MAQPRFSGASVHEPCPTNSLYTFIWLFDGIDVNEVFEANISYHLSWCVSIQIHLLTQESYPNEFACFDQDSPDLGRDFRLRSLWFCTDPAFAKLSFSGPAEHTCVVWLAFNVNHTQKFWMSINLSKHYMHSMGEQSWMWDRWNNSGPLWLWLVVMSSPTKSRSMPKLGEFESWCPMLSGLFDLPGSHVIFECNRPLVWITPISKGRSVVKVCVCVCVFIVFTAWPMNSKSP